MGGDNVHRSLEENFLECVHSEEQEFGKLLEKAHLKYE
jgi:hypothetical protein